MDLKQFYMVCSLLIALVYHCEGVPRERFSERRLGGNTMFNSNRYHIQQSGPFQPMISQHSRPFRSRSSTIMSSMSPPLAFSTTMTSMSPSFAKNLRNSSSSTGTTFQVAYKTPERVPARNFETGSGNQLVTHLQEFKKTHCTRVIQGTNFSNHLVEPTRKNGFISTVIQCYNGHHNLVVRPDDIWTAIISQFSLYINAESERFRRRFVNFDGKQTLKVHLGDGNLESVSYARFVRLMTDEIHKNIVDNEVKNWIMPNFSTTTEDDKITAGVIFMAALKKYFNYAGVISCGIPKITIEGTVDDWKNIAGRLTKLRSYKLESWVDDMLNPILDQFIRAKSGDVDKDFWNQIVSAETVGCGSTDITGWITAFSVFNDQGKWHAYVPHGKRWPRMDIDSIVSGVVHVDVLIEDHGVKHETVMFAGHLGKEVLPDGYTLQPRIGWAIALKNTTAASMADDHHDYNAYADY